MKNEIDWHKDPLTIRTKITGNYKNTQNVRRFFKSQVGKEIHFSREFMMWMKANTGKSLGDAVAEYKKQNAF